MDAHIASAVFATYAAAGEAVAALRVLGVPDAAISVLTPEQEHNSPSNERESIIRHLLGGGTLGAGIGVAALAIPGVGPLVAAGAIAATAVPTFAAAGASLGALAALLGDYGVEQETAERHEQDLRAGSVLLLVETRGTKVPIMAAQDALDQNGGRGRATSISPAN